MVWAFLISFVCLRTHAQLTMAVTSKISWDKLNYYRDFGANPGRIMSRHEIPKLTETNASGHFR